MIHERVNEVVSDPATKRSVITAMRDFTVNSRTQWENKFTRPYLTYVMVGDVSKSLTPCIFVEA